MDFKVSRKEQRMQPQGAVMVLTDDVFDLFPIRDNKFDPNIITDVEMLDDPNEEMLDRAMFAIVRQKGMDPVDEGEGVQWAEYVIGEVPSALILLQVQQAVYDEGPGVRLTARITPQGTSFEVGLTKHNTSGRI